MASAFSAKPLSSQFSHMLLTPLSCTGSPLESTSPVPITVSGPWVSTGDAPVRVHVSSVFGCHVDVPEPPAAVGEPGGVGVMGAGVVGAGLGLSEPGSQAKEARPEQQATSVRKERADLSMMTVLGIG